MVRKIIYHTTNRRKTGTACNNDQFFSFVIVNLKAVSVRSSDKEFVANIIFENLVGHLTHTTDCKINSSLADTADRNRRLTILRDGNLKELTRFCLAVKLHAEGVF